MWFRWFDLPSISSPIRRLEAKPRSSSGSIFSRNYVVQPSSNESVQDDICNDNWIHFSFEQFFCCFGYPATSWAWHQRWESFLCSPTDQMDSLQDRTAASKIFWNWRIVTFVFDQFSKYHTLSMAMAKAVGDRRLKIQKRYSGDPTKNTSK